MSVRIYTNQQKSEKRDNLLSTRVMNERFVKAVKKLIN